MRRLVLWMPLIAATVAAAWVLPALPFTHLGDPSHLAVLAYLGFLVLLVRHTRRRGLVPPRRLVATFLFGMPLVYLANWLLHGGSTEWLLIESAGLVLFGAMAWRGRVNPAWLVAGVAGHAVWDAAHIGGPGFVPDWYAIACAVVDVGVAGFVAGLALPGDPSPE